MGIHVIFKGYAKVYWHQGPFKLFMDERHYMLKQIYLLGSEESKPFTLSSGVHSFPFQFLLPENLPSSLKTEFGRISYDILLTVVNPLALNHVCIKSIRVNYALDLNSEISYQQPISYTTQCSSWWNVCGPQMIRVKFNTKTTGFQIGKPLSFHLIVENDTVFKCKDVSVKLRQIIRHLADEEANTIRVTIAEKSLGSIEKLTVRKFDDFIDVPITSSSSEDTCDIITTNYRIQIIVRTPRLHEDLIAVIPIVLGVVPIGGDVVEVLNVLDTRL
ncbi:arrestin domain-containing protein 1-like isoform X2 [Hermetia illucens]|uniref:arrestin domain-containing protein 1-like isoform X2 n=1 Tax=Hermetia illucens TaxID=343691 RepID=UPI0018CC37CE|nr:arrestin domain-containing protein 1-like isoform X2 [Hermetia illucens]